LHSYKINLQLQARLERTSCLPELIELFASLWSSKLLFFLDLLQYLLSFKNKSSPSIPTFFTSNPKAITYEPLKNVIFQQLSRFLHSLHDTIFQFLAINLVQSINFLPIYQLLQPEFKPHSPSTKSSIKLLTMIKAFFLFLDRLFTAV
jgi:hypothetical protein